MRGEERGRGRGLPGTGTRPGTGPGTGPAQTGGSRFLSVWRKACLSARGDEGWRVGAVSPTVPQCSQTWR